MQKPILTQYALKFPRARTKSGGEGKNRTAEKTIKKRSWTRETMTTQPANSLERRKKKPHKNTLTLFLHMLDLFSFFSAMATYK